MGSTVSRSCSSKFPDCFPSSRSVQSRLTWRRRRYEARPSSSTIVRRKTRMLMSTGASIFPFTSDSEGDHFSHDQYAENQQEGAHHHHHPSYRICSQKAKVVRSLKINRNAGDKRQGLQY